MFICLFISVIAMDKGYEIKIPPSPFFWLKYVSMLTTSLYISQAGFEDVHIYVFIESFNHHLHVQ